MPGPPSAPPEGVPIADLPHDSAGPRLNAVVWVLVSLASLFLGLRIYSKFLSGCRLWWDDYVLLAAWILLLSNASLISVAVAMGFGNHTWDLTIQQITVLTPMIVARSVLTIIATAWTKTSFALTVLRLTDGDWLRAILWAIIVSINLFLGLSVLLSFVSCTPVQAAWDPFTGGTCWTQQAVDYSIFAGVYSGVMDISLALLPAKMIWHLRMKKKEKIGIAIAMSMGLGAGAVAFVKSSKLQGILSADLYDAVDLLIWDIAEPCVTIMAASTPVLRVLIRDASQRNNVSVDEPEFLSKAPTRRQ